MAGDEGDDTGEAGAVGDGGARDGAGDGGYDAGPAPRWPSADDDPDVPPAAGDAGSGDPRQPTDEWAVPEITPTDPPTVRTRVPGSDGAVSDGGSSDGPVSGAVERDTGEYGTGGAHPTVPWAPLPERRTDDTERDSTPEARSTPEAWTTLPHARETPPHAREARPTMTPSPPDPPQWPGREASPGAPPRAAPIEGRNRAAGHPPAEPARAEPARGATAADLAHDPVGSVVEDDDAAPGGGAEHGAAPGDGRRAGDANGHAAPPRPRRRALVAGLVVVALLVGAGVASAVPAVSNRLGLPWAPNLPQGDPPEPLTVSRALTGPADSAPSPTPSGVAAALEGPTADPSLGTLGGSVVHPGSGTELWGRAADTPLTPASTTKLVTAAAALLTLDHEQRLPTTVVRGESPGTVVLVAGGDVTLSSLPEGQESIFPGAAHLEELVAQVNDATGGDIDRVRLDTSVYSGPGTAPGWEPVDTPSTYAVEIDPAMLDGGRSDPTDGGSMGVSDPSGELVGRLAEALGAEVGPPTTAPSDAEVLGEVTSAPVVDLVRQALRGSDNVLTEALARQVALAEGETASFAGAARAVEAVLEREAFDVSGVELFDGSGLSTRNRIPAGMLTDLLSVAAVPDADDPRTRALRPMLSGLPVAGGSGTLAGRYDGDAAGDGRGWVRAKTGTLDGVNALAGLVLDADGRVLVFAFLSEGGRIDQARTALDRAAASLRGCGCA